MKPLRRGAALAAVLIILVILLIMVVAFTYENQSQATFNAGVTLNSYYRTAATSILNEKASTLDAWVTASHSSLGAVPQWRMGSLLKAAPDADYPQYGVLLDSSFLSDGLGGEKISANAGMMELNYRVYVANNRDDPSFFYSGGAVGDDVVDDTWDMDGKVVMTVQVFPAGGDGTFDFAVNNPVTTISALVQSTGVDQVLLGLSSGSEGDDLTNSLNAGRGSEDAGLNPSSASPLSLGTFQGK